MIFFRQILLVTAIFFCIWVGGLVWFASTIAQDSTDNNEHTDAIVVLTGGSDRLREGLSLLQKNRASRLFVSGVGKGVTILDLFINAEFPRDKFDDLSRRIEMGYQARTTHENAAEVAQWVRVSSFRSIRLVTSNYHMKRSYFELRRMLPELKIIQHAVVPEQVLVDGWWQHNGTRQLIIREYNKLLGAIVQAEFLRRSEEGER